MARIFITGGTGFLGSEIIRQAIRAGHEVTALRRATSDVRSLDGLPIRWLIGDVSNRTMLEGAMAGQEYCIHSAGDTSYFLRDRERQHQVNVEGARNVLWAARRAGIRRLVHTSSVAAIGYDPQGKEADETTPWNWPSALPYMETKAAGERLILEGADEKLETIVLNPATILGPGRMNASEEQLLREIREEKVAAIPGGGMTVCDVSDVAAAHLAALTRGRSGQRYILGGTSLPHSEIMAICARAYGVRPPRRKAPKWVLGVAGGILLALERGRIPISTPAAMVRLAGLPIYHSSARARAELGYSPRPFHATLERVIAYQRGAR